MWSPEVLYSNRENLLSSNSCFSSNETAAIDMCTRRQKKATRSSFRGSSLRYRMMRDRWCNGRVGRLHVATAGRRGPSARDSSKEDLVLDDQCRLVDLRRRNGGSLHRDFLDRRGLPL